MEIEFYPQGVCCEQMNVQIEDDIIIDVKFFGGCHGNLQGIGRLIKGMKIEDVIDRLSGVHCREKLTSCPDQLAKCLVEYLIKIKKPV